MKAFLNNLAESHSRRISIVSIYVCKFIVYLVFRSSHSWRPAAGGRIQLLTEQDSTPSLLVALRLQIKASQIVHQLEPSVLRCVLRSGTHLALGVRAYLPMSLPAQPLQWQPDKTPTDTGLHHRPVIPMASIKKMIDLQQKRSFLPVTLRARDIATTSPGRGVNIAGTWLRPRSGHLILNVG